MIHDFILHFSHIWTNSIQASVSRNYGLWSITVLKTWLKRSFHDLLLDVCHEYIWSTKSLQYLVSLMFYMPYNGPNRRIRHSTELPD